MKEIFFIARVQVDFTLILLPTEYATYGEAQSAIPNLGLKGRFQVQKFFEV